MNPFSAQRDQTIAALGETALLRHIRSWLGSATPPPPFGMGDDVSVLPPETFAPARGRVLITVDGVSWGQHFDAGASPQQAGRKLVNRNLSDIAAMGGVPGPAVCALQAGPDLRLDWLEGFTRGMAEACLGAGVALAGGDLAGADSGSFSSFLTLTGTAERPVPRTGSQPGDWIGVTGPLGGSILGRHLDFAPRLREGQWLAGCTEVVAMMDLSDGLGKDLPTFLTEETCALLDPAKIPLSPACRELAGRTGKNELAHALNDGEDHKLLFTLRIADGDGRGEEALTAFQNAYRKAIGTECRMIGRIAATSQPHEAGRLLQKGTHKPLGGSGFEHFINQR
jgi:thiamine-monophosphate kinase